MAIPKLNELLLPFLKAIGDGKVHHREEVITALADKFQLTAAERAAVSPGGIVRFPNLIDWCRSHYISAGFIENTGESAFRITRLGADELALNPAVITVKYLRSHSKG